MTSNQSPRTVLLRVWGGSYHDYWFTEDAILKIRLVPQSFTLIGIVLLVALATLLGILGLVVGASVALLIYVLSRRIARRKHWETAELSIEAARKRGLVTLRIPYSVISHAELKANRLTISIEGRKIHINVQEEIIPKLRGILRGRLPSDLGNLTV